MKMNVKNLSLVDVVIHRQGSLLVRSIHFVLGIAVSIFFRRIELYNSEHLPEKSGLIFVSNHPNALIDPLLLFVALPRNVAFLAKSTLFRFPVIGFLIRAVGALPLYRQQDSGQDVSKNQETFSLTREILKKGGSIAIFPEGVSHDSPKLMPLKTGAARIALGSVSSGKNPAALDLKIVPVGLFYTNKTDFRSEALLHFGEPIDVLPVELDENGQPAKHEVKELTAEIERGLREVTVNAETDAELEIARFAEEVFTSTTPHEENLVERLGILQKFLAEPNNDSDPKLEKRLAEFDRNLRKLGIESEFLTLADFSKKFVLKQAFLRSWFLFLLAPLMMIGAVVHYPAFKLCDIIASFETRKRHFDMASTMKALSGLVLMPITWLMTAVVLNYFFGWKVALVSIPLSFLCGWVALRSLEEIGELRGWLKAISLFFLKREKFLRLLAERKILFERVRDTGK